MTLDEAIIWLRVHGCFATPRTWNGARAVYVAKAPVDDGEIRVLENALFIHGAADAGAITRTRHGGQATTQTFQSLDEPLRIALQWIDEPPPWPQS